MKSATNTKPEQIILVPGVVARLPLDALVPDPEQPRTLFDPDALHELAADIKLRGVEQPILVRSDGFQYVIKHGERRWRASQIAGVADIPCLLAAAADEKRPEVERLLDQATDNHHQRNLTPIEWGQVFKRLTEQHDLAVKDIPAELDRRGIRSMSRPYISNLMRLTELPDWAQTLITDGEITASDGKAILMARPYPKAMAWLKNKIQQESRMRKEGQRVRDVLFTDYDYRDMEHLVTCAYEETAIDLTASFGENAPLFKWETSCKACPDRQQFNKENFCLNATCFDAKQAKAREGLKSKGQSEEKARKENGRDTKPKKPAGPTKINPKKIAEDGVVTIGNLSPGKFHFLDEYDVRFSPAMNCVGCEFNQKAVQGKDSPPRECCFNIPHFDQLQRNGNREEGIAQWLDKRILPEVLAHLPENHELNFQIIAWMALRAPVQNEHDTRVHRSLEREQESARCRLNLTTPSKVIKMYQQGALDAASIAGAGVRAMMADRANFYAFARHLGIELNPETDCIDEEYVALKRKGELIELIGGDKTELGKLKLDELVKHCLTPEVIKAVGVPPDVRKLYTNIQPFADPMHSDVSPDERDENSHDDQEIDEEEDTDVGAD